MKENDLRDLNVRAQEKFEELKKKLQINIQRPAIKELATAINDKSKVAITEEDFTSLQDYHSGLANQAELLEAAQFVDTTFDFIASLNLSSNSSLAIGLIISANKTGDKSDFNKAIAALNKEIGL